MEEIVDSDSLVEHLSRLDGEEFLNVMSKVLRARTPYPDQEYHIRSGFFLGVAYADVLSDPAEPVMRWGKWKWVAAAYPDPKHYPGGRGGDDFCQSGKCNQCDTPLLSTSKRVICPICGADAYLT